MKRQTIPKIGFSIPDHQYHINADSSFLVYSFPLTHQKVNVSIQHESKPVIGYTNIINGHVEQYATAQLHAHTVLKEQSHSILLTACSDRD